MRALVTGAAGFIGSNLVDVLLALGDEVIGVDNFSTGQSAFLEKAQSNPKFTFVQVDLVDPIALKSRLDGVDIVYHLAANADIRRGLGDPGKDLQQNTVVTFNVLEAMRRQGVKRIVFASSAAALGEPSVFPTPESCAIPVQTSLYGASKMACEGLISSYCEGYGFEGYAFRFVSILGQRYPHGHVFDFVKFLREDPTALPILGDGSQRKSYLHVDDCTNALIHICRNSRTAQHSRHRFEVYHLGTEEYCFVRDSASWISEALGLDPEFRFSGGDRGWVGDNPFVFLDVNKALGTGWAPTHSIKESVQLTVEWLVNNEWIFSCR